MQQSRPYRWVWLCVVLGVAVVCATALASPLPAAQDGAVPRPVGPRLFNDQDKYWLSAREDVYRELPDLLGQHKRETDAGVGYRKFMHGDPAQKTIALTFDDGPHPAFTPKLLALLKKYHVQATFFVVGEKAEQTPALVKAEVAAGHVVGNHTYHHVNLTKIPPMYVATEIKACDEVLRSIIGHVPVAFRPPGGDYNSQVADISQALNYSMILWTDDPGDYARPPKEVIISRTLAHASNGGIILLHDGVQQTLDVLPTIITTLRAQGYRFVTIEEMMKETAAGERWVKTPVIAVS